MHEHHWREGRSTLSRASDHMHRAHSGGNVAGVGACHKLEEKNAGLFDHLIRQCAMGGGDMEMGRRGRGSDDGGGGGGAEGASGEQKEEENKMTTISWWWKT